MISISASVAGVERNEFVLYGETRFIKRTGSLSHVDDMNRIAHDAAKKTALRAVMSFDRKLHWSLNWRRELANLFFEACQHILVFSGKLFVPQLAGLLKSLDPVNFGKGPSFHLKNRETLKNELGRGGEANSYLEALVGFSEGLSAASRQWRRRILCRQFRYQASSPASMVSHLPETTKPWIWSTVPGCPS